VTLDPRLIEVADALIDTVVGISTFAMTGNDVEA
jgi:hypothetical protein